MQPSSPPTSRLRASYFNGVSARAQAVTLHVTGSVLWVTGEGVERAVPLREVQWPERTRHGIRMAHFQGGGSVQCADPSAWDAWCAQSGRHEPLLVSLQQSWRWVMVSALVLAALLVALQLWGLPVFARAVVAVTPLTVDASLGEASLASIDVHLMRPSKLALSEQERLRAAFARAVASLPTGSLPAWQLVFRHSRIGPNAFALPGGTMVMTDELVALVGGDEQVVTAVLAHELGHVQHRHGLRMLVQVTVLGGAASAVLGDFSSLLASVPIFLGQASYSREAEREADAGAVRLLNSAAISPAVMVTLFDKLEEKRRRPGEDADRLAEGDNWLGIAFSSHPPDADRVRFFKEGAVPR